MLAFSHLFLSLNLTGKSLVSWKGHEFWSQVDVGINCVSTVSQLGDIQYIFKPPSLKSTAK